MKTILRAAGAVAAAACLFAAPAGDYDFRFAVLRYGGGGDWYESTVGVKNLMAAFAAATKIAAAPEAVAVAADSSDLFLYPLIFINGHGNIFFTPSEVAALRRYVECGGFIFANDDYGMDESFRREMKKVFPESPLTPLPTMHPVYTAPYAFPAGLPKIHEHDGKPPEGLGIFLRGRLVVFYAYSADIADGWADADVHKDPEYKRDQGIRMGINVIVYALEH